MIHVTGAAIEEGLQETQHTLRREPSNHIENQVEDYSLGAPGGYDGATIGKTVPQPAAEHGKHAAEPVEAEGGSRHHLAEVKLSDKEGDVQPLVTIAHRAQDKDRCHQ